MAYATVSQVKSYLGISASTDDTLLGTFIAAAQKIIDAHTRGARLKRARQRHAYLMQCQM